MTVYRRHMWSRRLVVVEDEPLVASLLCQVLHEAGFQARACDGAVEATTLVREFDPDGVLIDINLGDGPSGLHLGHLLKRTHPHLGLVFLTKYRDPRVSGPRGMNVPKGSAFLAKDLISDTAMLIEAVETVLGDGKAPLRHLPAKSPGIAALTRTQLEILRLAACGLTNAAIADHRKSSERTVEQRLQSIYRSLEIPEDPMVNRRVEAVRQYIAAIGMPVGPGAGQVVDG
jgi:DNA-binding NarL/FixJ family response regulator